MAVAIGVVVVEEKSSTDGASRCGSVAWAATREVTVSVGVAFVAGRSERTVFCGSKVWAAARGSEGVKSISLSGAELS